MRNRLNLEALESRLTPSTTINPAAGSDLVLAPGSDSYLAANAQIHSLTVPPTASLTIGNGVKLTVAGGTSDIGGAVHYQGLYSGMQLKGGQVDLHGTFVNDFSPDGHMVNFLDLNSGAKATVHGATFDALAIRNGLTPQWGGFSVDQTSELTFTGAADFTNGGYVDNYANLLFSNAGSAVKAQEVILDTGHAEVTVTQAELDATLITSPRTQLEVLPGASLDVGTPNVNPWTGSTLANVYVATPNTVQIDQGGSLVAGSVQYEGHTYGGGQVLVTDGGLGGFYLDPISLARLEQQAFPQG